MPGLVRGFFVLCGWLILAVPVGAGHDKEPEPFCGANGINAPAASGLTEISTPSGLVHLDRADGIDPFRWLAHGVFHDRPRDQLDNGYIISLEKLPKHERLSGPHHQRPILRTYSDLPDGPPAHVAAKRDRWLSRMFKDPKLQVATHITRYDAGQACGLVNPYHDAANPMPLCDAGVQPDRPTFKAGIDGLFQHFLSDLTARLRDGDYTHVVFASMGWNNDQRVSICRYRRIMDQTARAMPPGQEFRPLVIGMTWSSSWWPASPSRVVHALGHIGSVLNKATDSDEAGVLHGNVILNRLVPHANRAGLPVVVLGHSMGARLAGRALFSRDLLRLGAEGPPADLAVFLQPAHSIFRYGRDVDGARGNEGHPYDPYRTMPDTRVVVTTSMADDANPFAIWSPYIGGDRGWRVAGREVFQDLVHTVEMRTPSDEETLAAVVPRRVTLINAGFIAHHSDILDKEVGQFLAHLITAYASR